MIDSTCLGIRPITVTTEDIILFTQEFDKEELIFMLKQLQDHLSCGVSVKRANFLLCDMEVTKASLRYLDAATNLKNYSNN